MCNNCGNYVVSVSDIKAVRRCINIINNIIVLILHYEVESLANLAVRFPF